MRELSKYGALIGIIAECALLIAFFMDARPFGELFWPIVGGLALMDLLGWGILYGYAEDYHPEWRRLTYLAGPIGRLICWFWFFLDAESSAPKPPIGQASKPNKLVPPKYVELH